MGIMTTGTASLSQELRTIYDRNLLSRLLPRLVWALFGQPKPMPANEGQTVNFRRFASLSAATTPLTEGVTPAGSELSVSAITVSPAQYGDYIKISDYLDFTAPDPILLEGGQLLAEQAADTIDQLVRDVVVAGTTVQYAGASSASRVTVGSADKLNATEIQKAVRTFQTNKARPITSILNASTGVGTKPVAGGYVGIVGAQTLYDLKQDSKFIPVHEYGSSAGGTLPGEVGALDEVRFIRTDNPKVYTGAGEGGIDVHATILFAADSFGIISPKGVENIVKPFGAGDDALNQRATSGWKMLMASVILQQLAILRIEHAVS
jgi:N4-gp56 family major capsid protein